MCAHKHDALHVTVNNLTCGWGLGWGWREHEVVTAVTANYISSLTFSNWLFLIEGKGKKKDSGRWRLMGSQSNITRSGGNPYMTSD